MRLPVTPQLSTKDGTSNKNARLTNVLKEVSSSREFGIVRPGLSSVNSSTGNGNGLVCYNNELISVYGATLYKGTQFTVSDRVNMPLAGVDALYWLNVTTGAGMFCAVSVDNNNNNGYSATSADGITWTLGALDTGHYAVCVTYGNGIFCALSSDGFSYTSLDGLTWTRHSGVFSNPSSIAYGAGVFCAMVASNTNVCYTSPDGITWTQRTIGGSVTWKKVIFNGAIFCAVGSNTGGNLTFCITSSDGINWFTRNLPSGHDWRSVAWSGTTFCAVSIGSAAATSPDGISWAASTLTSTSWFDIGWDGNFFMAVPASGTFPVAYSTDGSSWFYYQPSFITSYRRIASLNGKFFVTDDFSSTNGSTFVLAPPPLGTVVNDKFDFVQSPL